MPLYYSTTADLFGILLPTIARANTAPSASSLRRGTGALLVFERM